MPGQTIGEISIKVRPDTTKFPSELRAELKKINDDFKVDVGLHTQGALAEFKALKAAIEGDEIKAKLDVNTKGLGAVAGYRKPLAGVATAFTQIQRSLEAASRASANLARSVIAARRASIAAVAQTITWAAQMIRLAVSVETARKAWNGFSKTIQAVTRRANELSIVSRLLAAALLTAGKVQGIRLANFVRELDLVNRAIDIAARGFLGLVDVANKTNKVLDRVFDGINFGVATMQRGLIRAGIELENLPRLARQTHTAIIRIALELERLPNLVKNGISTAIIRAGLELETLAQKTAQAVQKAPAIAARGYKNLQVAVNRVALEMERMRNISLSGVLTAAVNGFRRVQQAAINTGKAIGRAGKNISRGIGTAIDSGVKGIGKLFSSAFSTMASAAGSVGSALAGMSKNLLIVLAIAAIIAPLIGLVAGLIAGLPSLLAAAGAAFAAVALGMDGIKEAAKTLQPQVDELKRALSERWESGLTPIFDQLKAVFPVIQEGLLLVTDGLLKMAQGFTNAVTSVAGMEYLRTILAGVGQLFAGITPMVTNMTHAFLQLAAAGAQNFGFLIDVLNRFGASFADMSARITGSTAFADAMRGMSVVLDSLLQGFVRLMEAGTVAMGQLGGPMATLINGLVDAFISLMPILSAISGLLFNVLGTALSALAPVFTALGPPIQQLANILGPVLTAAISALVPILTPLATFLGTVLTTALNALMPLVQPLVGLFGQLGQMLGGILTQAASALTPLITTLGGALTQIVAAVSPLIPAFGQLAMAIIPPLIGVLLQLMPVILQLVQTVLPILVSLIQAAVPVIVMIAEAFAQILPPIISFVGQILGAVIPVVTSLLSVIQSVFPSIQGIIDGVMNVIKGVINVVLGVITGDWTRAWNGLKQILSGAFNAIVSAITGAIGLIIGIVTQIGPKILSALGNLGSLLFNAGKSIITGLINGIKSMIGAAANAVSGVVSKIRGFFPFSPAKEGPFSGKGYTTYSGRALVKDWAKGIEDEAPRAVRAVEEMMNATNSAANAEWNGQIESESFGITGSVFEGVMAAFSGSRLQVDGTGMAKLVNKTNNRNARR